MHLKTKFLILIDDIFKLYSVILSGAKNLILQRDTRPFISFRVTLLSLVTVSILILFFTCPAFCKNIAVIPFQNITGDKEKNWVGAGFAETLTTKIVKVKAITVIEREQLSKILEEIKFQYSGAVDEKTAVEKGKMYGADVMIFGSFQVVGEKLRVTARFVDVQTRKVIDTAEANGNISDIFKLQDEIAFSLMDSLKIVLAEKEKKEIKINPTENLTAYQWFSKGYEASTLKLYDKAVEYYTKAIKIDPKDTEAYNNRGTAYYYKELFDEAIEDYTKAIKIDPKDAEAYNNRGIAYAGKELYGEAIEDYTKAIQINPKLAAAYYGRGNAYAGKELYGEAIEDYTKAIKIDPKNAEAYNNRGIAYENKGLSDEAIEDYTKAIQINPKLAVAYYNRGIIYAEKELYDEAIKDYTKAIKIDPNCTDTYLKRGSAYFYKGLCDEVIEDCTKAIQINPKLAVAYYNRGSAYGKKGLNKLCISDWKKATDLGNEKARQSLKEFHNIDY